MTDIQLVHASETPYFPIQKFDNETGKPKIKHIYVSIIRFMDGTIKRISIHENRFMVAATCKAIEDLANLYIEKEDIQGFIDRYKHFKESSEFVLLSAKLHKMCDELGIIRNSVKSFPDGVAFILELAVKTTVQANGPAEPISIDEQIKRKGGCKDGKCE